MQVDLATEVELGLRQRTHRHNVPVIAGAAALRSHRSGGTHIGGVQGADGLDEVTSALDHAPRGDSGKLNVIVRVAVVHPELLQRASGEGGRHNCCIGVPPHCIEEVLIEGY